MPINLLSTNIFIDDEKVHLELRDTAGQERFRCISNSSYRGISGIIFVYDITNQESFENIPKWIKEAKRYSMTRVVAYIVGAKSDLNTERKVTWEDADNLSKKENIPFLETSSKTSSNVTDLFTKLAEKLLNEEFNEQFTYWSVNKVDSLTKGRRASPNKP